MATFTSVTLLASTTQPPTKPTIFAHLPTGLSFYSFCCANHIAPSNAQAPFEAYLTTYTEVLLSAIATTFPSYTDQEVYAYHDSLKASGALAHLGISPKPGEVPESRRTCLPVRRISWGVAVPVVAPQSKMAEAVPAPVTPPPSPETDAFQSTVVRPVAGNTPPRSNKAEEAPKSSPKEGNALGGLVRSPKGPTERTFNENADLESDPDFGMRVCSWGRVCN